MKMPVSDPTAWYSLKTVRSASPPCEEAEERAARKRALVGRKQLADGLDDRGIGVDQRHRRGHAPSCRNARTLEDERNPDRFFVHVGLSPKSPRAEVIAVVARVDDKRIGGEPGLVESPHHASNIVIEERDHAVVRGNGDPHVLFVAEMILVVLHLAELLQDGMVGKLRRVAKRRHRQLREIVKIEEFQWRDQREVRADEGYEQAPGPVRSVVRDILQPPDRFVANVPVVLKIRRLPGAGVAGELARAVACRRRAAQHALNVAFAFQDMQWENFVVEAVRIVVPR